MLSKPQHGWTTFSLGHRCYSISFLTNVPLDWLEKAIGGLDTLLPFEVSGYCEPGRVVCTVAFSQCHVFYENEKHQKEESSYELVPVNMLDFCQSLYDDISGSIDDWQSWSPSYAMSKEDLLCRLERLQKLIKVKAACFLYGGERR